MTMPIRRCAAVLAAAAVLLTAACASTPEPAPSGDATTGAARELTIGLTYTPDIQFAPFYVAEANGHYAATGVDVTLRHHGQSESLFGALDAGEEDLVVAGGDEMLQARSEGVGVTSVATLYQEYPVVLIVPADSDITAPGDLAGRTVGIPGPFGETYFGLLALLSGADLTEDDVTVEHIGFTQQAALTAGHVDAVVGFSNNDAVQFEAAGLPVRTIELATGGVPLLGIGLGASEAAADDAVLDAVVEATLLGVRDVIADPAGAVDIAADYIPGLSGTAQQEAALATLEATVPLYGPAGEVGASSEAQWQAMADFMTSQGLLAGDVDITDAMTTRHLPVR
ncbi:ABC transporter substrate-binding protein [Georgenia sp. MJ170]|uniref:ABC transporter substrate-binding protein n=1 Tax=Georgenia sunbinii TaxID=3117728 RepID=UPI002F265B1E